MKRAGETPIKPSYGYRLARHVLRTFTGKDDVLTPEQLQSSRAKATEEDAWGAMEVSIPGRNREGREVTEQLIRSSTGALALVTTAPDGAEIERVSIPRYGDDPVEKIFGGLIMRELVHVANETVIDDEARQASEMPSVV